MKRDSPSDPDSSPPTPAPRVPAAPSSAPRRHASTGAPVASSAGTRGTAEVGGWRHTFSSLSNRDFLFLWLGVLAMMGGMQMQMLARGYLVYDLTDSASLLGVVNAGAAAPMLLLALFGGVVADRLERKRVIQAGQGLAGLLALVVGVAIAAGAISWYYLLAASVVQGSLFAFMMPARQAIIPQLVGRGQLSNAMALNAAAMSATTLISPAIAGGLYAFAGPDNVYFVIAGLSACAFVLTGMIGQTDAAPTGSRAPVARDIIAGLSYIRHSPLVMVLLVMGLATALLAMPFRFLMPVFVVDIYHRGPEAMGLLVAVMGAGALAGSLFIASLGRRKRGMLLIFGSLLSGVSLLLLAALPFYYVAAAIMVPLGIGDAGRRSLNQALIMEEMEDQYRGRVMSVFMMNFGLMPLGVLPAGLVADALGGQAAIGLLAVLLLAFTLGVLLTQRRLRQMP